jgi:hypothetical protein
MHHRPSYQPFETEREAHAAALKAGGPPRPGWSILSGDQNRQMLTAACEAAGVDLGAHDARILAWLAGFEDSTCAVIAGLITRAHAGRSSEPGSPDIGELRAIFTQDEPGPHQPRYMGTSPQCVVCGREHAW